VKLRPALILAFIVVLLAPLTPDAQLAKRVGVVYYGVTPGGADLRALLDTLRELGWVEGGAT